jgi:tripartite motif-containing protein 71
MQFRSSVTRRVLLLVSLLIAASLPYLTSAQNTDNTEPVTGAPLELVWQSEFSSDAALIAPSDLVVDAASNVYVSTQAKQNIKKFDSDGKFIMHWGGFGNDPGEFNLSSGIAVDTQGNVYVADFNNTRIQKFDSEGTFLLEWETEPPIGPASLTVDAGGYVYVDNFFNHRHVVQKFDSNGNLVHQWGDTGRADGEFAPRPEDVTIDSNGDIYIVDRLNHRIQKFDSDGNFLAKFGGEPGKTGQGQFYEPIGVAVDAEGNIYVHDNYYLQKLDAEGNFITQWQVTKDGNLDHSRGIVAVDSEGYIYVLASADAVSPSGEKVHPVVVKKFRQPEAW